MPTQVDEKKAPPTRLNNGGVVVSYSVTSLPEQGWEYDDIAFIAMLYGTTIISAIRIARYQEFGR